MQKVNAAAQAAVLPKLPPVLLDLLVEGPMTVEAVEDASRTFNKALSERALGAGTSLWREPSSPTNLTVMPPQRRRRCPVCCKYEASEQTIELIIRMSQRESENGECEGSNRPAIPSAFPRCSELLHRSFVQVAI
jgi:hypothetical protein